MNRDSVIIRPIITEHTMKLVDTGKFTFQVATEASKAVVKQTVAKKFSVDVTGVAFSTVKGKRKRTGTRRTEVRVFPWKKATVTLKKGQKINMFDLGGHTE